jgi:hypothetical protein
MKVKIHKYIILSVVLYGCETWSLILREEHIKAIKVVRGMWQALERRTFTGFWWERQKERDYLKDQIVGGRMGLEDWLEYRVDTAGSG